jgi:long-subunit fatty acid transport protein
MIDRVLPSYDLPQEEEQKQLERKMAYGVNGGYNLGKGEGNFTVGVNVRRKLSKRLALETGIAYVSGSNTSHQETVETSNLTPGTPAGFNVTSVTYEPVKNSVHYLQAAPSLNYQVLPGFSAGGGVDAQRLLTKASKAISTNNIGEPESAQPQWDFGVTARMDYQVIKRLKAGVMYRESVGAVSKQASQTAKRNYLLMQLSYTIF